ncbi:hypothetical protein ISN45_Aa01g031190 [Arabidopsis thaliana x Arabidopsis arenosa]|uniref:Uncharacterized protein n=1 Tax=Arabidopsis thaliana x Arabidopsis arenosa TaxID=1240361 RepID=A0A8T2C8F5_9BRAS|nr:hypothetical protein ISN45_Aa01g031190 [Arabidopsis thaliana x Arabidopsis arenosa]
MANRENQNHTLCLLVVTQTLIPAISVPIPASILTPSFLLHTLSLLRVVFSCDPRILLLFISKSVCPESGFCFHWIRYVGVSPSSEISSGWWKFSLSDKVRFPKPPWMSSTFCAFSRHWDRITIFMSCAIRIANVVQINGDVDRQRLRCFVKEYNWGKFRLELFLHMSYTADLEYKIVSDQRMEKWDWVFLFPIKEKYLRQQLRKRGRFGMKEEIIVSMRKQYQRLISKNIKSKSSPHRKTRLRKFWYPIVLASELMLESLGLTMQCAIWESSQVKLSTHTIRIRARSDKEKENIGFKNPIASKAYLRKASSNSLFFLYLS